MRHTNYIFQKIFVVYTNKEVDREEKIEISLKRVGLIFYSETLRGGDSQQKSLLSCLLKKSKM